jgi:hypothetical protein
MMKRKGAVGHLRRVRSLQVRSPESSDGALGSVTPSSVEKRRARPQDGKKWDSTIPGGLARGQNVNVLVRHTMWGVRILFCF